MEDIRVDSDGNHRCWKCGSKNFELKRTFGAKAAVGVGALLTHKKLKCQDCGAYNDTGNAQPWVPPEQRTWNTMTFKERANTPMSYKDRVAANKARQAAAKQAKLEGKRARSRHK